MRTRRVLVGVLIATAIVGCSYWRGGRPEMPVAPDTWATTVDKPSQGLATVRRPSTAVAPPPGATAPQNCTVDQILSMKTSGLTEEQIRRACEPK